MAIAYLIFIFLGGVFVMTACLFNLNFFFESRKVKLILTLFARIIYFFLEDFLVIAAYKVILPAVIKA